MNPKTVGRSFGILKIQSGSLEFDLNIPRRDNKVGMGHKGFEVEVDPSMSVEEAALRRDFTINSMAFDLLTGDLHDFFGGLRDLDLGVLRATDPALFVQDPLRALRGMQLLARKAKTVDPGTMVLIKGMQDEFDELPKERIHEEFRKLLLKADRPSVGFEFLRESGWIKHFPDLVALIGCPQREDWHPEGDVWTHSLMAADAAAEVRHLVPVDQREAFVFGAFLHDVGKPAHTITQEMIDRRDPIVLKKAEAARRPVEDMLLTAHGHDTGGMDPAKAFMRRLTNSTKLIALVRGIVGLHMQPYGLFANGGTKGGYTRLHRKLQAIGGDLRLIGRVCQCDSCATGFGRSLASGEPDWDHEVSVPVFDWAEEFENEPEAVEPKVMGRDLVAAGLKPGPQIGKLLRTALEMQDSDASLTKTDLLERILPEGFHACS